MGEGKRASQTDGENKSVEWVRGGFGKEIRKNGEVVVEDGLLERGDGHCEGKRR